jgi:hypothetical protein
VTVGVKERPIYLHDMPAVAWALLWWLICKMDENCEIRGGWRIAAAGDMKKHRQWIGKCAEILQEHGLIDTAAKQRYVKVLTGRITG